MLKAEYNRRDKTADSLFIHSDPACWRLQPWRIALSPSLIALQCSLFPARPTLPMFFPRLAQIMHSAQKREYNGKPVTITSAIDRCWVSKITRNSLFERAELYKIELSVGFICFVKFVFI